MEITGYTNTAEVKEIQRELIDIGRNANVKLDICSMRIFDNKVINVYCHFLQKGNMSLRHKLLAKGWHEYLRRRIKRQVVIYMYYVMK